MSRYDWTGVTTTSAESRMQDEAEKRVPDLVGENVAAFPNALLAELAAGTMVVGNVRSYGAVGDGVADDTEAIQACVDAHEVVYFPPGEYVVTFATWDPAGNGGSGAWVGRRYAVENVDYWKIGVRIPTGRRLFGAGFASVIRTNLPDISSTAKIAEAVTDTADDSGAWFFVDFEADDVSFDNLRFVGQGPVVTPDNFMLNLQMAVIEAGWQGGDGRDAPNRLKIRDCWFQRQYGFTLHQRGGGQEYEFIGNRSTDCMNGPNINSDRQINERNFFERSEGFECGGKVGTYRGNVFRDVYGAIGVGGNMSTGQSNWLYGAVIDGNIIERALRCPPSNPHASDYQPPAVSIADNQYDVIFSHNIIQRCETFGLAIHADPSRQVGRVQVLDSHFIGINGISIYSPGAVDDLTIDRVVIMDRRTDGTRFHADELLFSGTVTSASTTVLTDSVQSLESDRYRGRFIRMTSGTQAGVEKLIIDNDATTLTVNTPWEAAPQPGDAYQVLTLYESGPGIVINETGGPMESLHIGDVAMRIGNQFRIQVAGVEWSPRG